MSNIIMKQREIPLNNDYDVIVVGGGVSGAFAGIAAARDGLKALIIEQFGSLGGSATMGLVTPLMSSNMPNYTGHSPLGVELTQRMKKLGGTEDKELEFDGTMMKFALEEMAMEYGAKLLYHTSFVEAEVENNKIKHIVVLNKSGLTAYGAKYFIDATGDADVAFAAGVKCNVGNDKGVNQPVSLRFEMAGIDFDRFHEHMRELGNNGKKYFAMNTAGMAEIIENSRKDGMLTDMDASYFQAFGVPGKADAMNFNCPELSTMAGIVNAEFITQKQIEGKQAILRFKRFLKEKIRGFENAYITEVAPYVGFRESRRIEADYIMTIHDILGYHKFDDAVIKNRYPVDVHGVDDVTLGLKYDDSLPKDEQYWEVPFRCMIAKGLDNLLVSGRCAGFDFRAQSAARVQLICRAMGEAAGLGCALAEKHGGLRAFPLTAIREKLIVE